MRNRSVGTAVAPQHIPMPRMAGSADREIDPVCGMEVDPANAAGEYNYEGRTYYFCSASCLAKFKADPLTYLARTSVDTACPTGVCAIPTSPTETGMVWTCPMHPEVRQSGPGACPICGMALEPAAPTRGSREP